MRRVTGLTAKVSATDGYGFLPQKSTKGAEQKKRELEQKATEETKSFPFSLFRNAFVIFVCFCKNYPVCEQI